MTHFTTFGKTYISYGTFHHNIVNKWIHIFCVPVLSATLVSILSFIPLDFSIAGMSFGVAEMSVVGAMIYYFIVNISFALGMGLLMAIVSLIWKHTFSGLDQADFFKWVLGANMIAYALLYIGHSVFEKRRPPFIDNITQIMTAPLFVIVDIFDVLGLRSAEMILWREQIDKNVEEIKKKDKKE